MSERINVLAVMDEAITHLEHDNIMGTPQRALVAPLCEARAAVAELIEAQCKAHVAMLLADWNVPGQCSKRKHDAYLASAAALARVEAR